MAACISAKQVLRKQMKKVLAGISPSEQLRKSSAVIEKVLKSDEYRRSQRIAVYLTMKGEIDTQALVADMFKSDKMCFIPRYETSSNHMDMLQLYSMSDLERLPLTKWNIRQPADDDNKRLNALDSGGLDLVIVPGLAFTLSGERLGRGKGYYDTFLSRHVEQVGRRPTTMALAFSEQVVADVPTSEHDYLIDAVISD